MLSTVVKKIKFAVTPRPRNVVLIRGCPRSGTTCVYEWLNQSEDTVAFNEERIEYALDRYLSAVYEFKKLHDERAFLEEEIRELLFRYCNRQKPLRNKVLVLKNPGGVDRLTENMKTLFPELKIVVMLRHPVEVVNSMLKRKWGYSVNGAGAKSMSLEDAIKTWKQMVGSIVGVNEAHIYVCHFERLISEPEQESAKLRAFLNIEGLDMFKPKQTQPVDLPEADIQKILKETEAERAYFGYGRDTYVQGSVAC